MIRFRRLSLLLSFLAFGALVLPASAQERTPPQLIDAQIDAFRDGDFVTAFGFASTELRAIFGTPEAFGRMVRQGYPMVLDPAEIRYLDLGERGGAVVQRVLILDRDGRSYLLEYLMRGTGAQMRIAGVSILPETGTGV